MIKSFGIALLGILIIFFTNSWVYADVPCDVRNNNTHKKLLECVSIDGVYEHLLAFQEIADANDSSREAGTMGDEESIDYMVTQLLNADYDVVLQPINFFGWRPLSPSTLVQTGPGLASYQERIDYNLVYHSDSADIIATVTPIEPQLVLGNMSTSGCEISDFAGFSAGNIALIQRGQCDFLDKVNNAVDAGASGVILFNQGDTENRKGLINVALPPDFNGNIPVLFATYDRGAEWAITPGLQLNITTDVFRGEINTHNIFAESFSGRNDNVVMVGAHLDSFFGTPGIQDNGSGAAALLEVALQMHKVKPRNKLRFAWWAAEEHPNFVGSSTYIFTLSQEERDKIALGAFPNSGSKKRNVIVINPPKRRVYSTVIKQQSKTHEWRFGRPNLL